MALGITNQDVPHVLGSLKARVVTVAFDSSYPTGGESLTAADLGLDELLFVSAVNSGGYVFTYDYTNKKILAYYGDNNNASDGPLIEVPDTTSLAAITSVRLLALGR